MLTDRQWARSTRAVDAGERHLAVWLAWWCAQQRAAYRHPRTERGRTLAAQMLEFFPSCPVPEIARLGTCRRLWRSAGYP